MQIVIELDEEEFKDFVDNGRDIPLNHLCGALYHGTPLPKGHGRLIDADEFGKRLMDARSYYLGEKADGFDLRFAAGLKSAVERLVDAPTIIPADKEESEWHK